jgi:starch phosphorylase
LAERVYPAADLCEQISTAGFEASGTGNMKFALNGSLTIGTLDGANVEIRDRVGAENFFLFGHTVDQLETLAPEYRPRDLVAADPWLEEALALVEAGHFCEGDRALFRPLLDRMLGHDPFFVLADFSHYRQVQDEVARLWLDPMVWQRSSLLNTARSGFFSSDRAIREYAQRIWDVKPYPVPMAPTLASIG